MYLKEYLKQENKEIIFKDELLDSFRVSIKDNNNDKMLDLCLCSSFEELEEAINVKITTIKANIKISPEYMEYLKLKCNIQLL